MYVYGMYAFIRLLIPFIQRLIRFILLLLWLTTMLLLFWFSFCFLNFAFVFVFGSTNDTFKYLQLLYFKIVFLVYFNHMPFCQNALSHASHTHTANRPLSSPRKYATLFIIPKLISRSMHYVYLLLLCFPFPFLFFFVYLFIFNLSTLTSLSRNICFILIAMHSFLLLLLLRLRLCCFSRICLVYV